jgi:phosphate uptake regulator
MGPLEDASNDARLVVEDSIDALYGSDVKLANKVIDEMGVLKEKIDRLNVSFLNLDDVEMAIVLGIVVDSIERTADYGTNIAETAINMAIATKSGKN